MDPDLSTAIATFNEHLLPYVYSGLGVEFSTGRAAANDAGIFVFLCAPAFTDDVKVAAIRINTATRAMAIKRR